MKFNKDLLKEKWFAYTFALCSAVVLYLALTHISGIVHLLKAVWKVGAPVFTAFVIAYVLAPLVRVYSKYVLYKVEPGKLRHTLSVLLTILTVVLFFTVLMVALVPQVIESIVMFVGNLNGYVLSFQKLMRRLSSLAAQHDIDLSQFITSSDELLQSITRVLPENLNKILNLSYGFGTKLLDWVISFILAIYLMMDGRNLREGFKRLLHALLTNTAFENTASFWRRCNTILIRYIAFDLLDGMIIGLMNWLFMVVMNMPYVAIISMIVGVTNLAPTFGPMIGAVIGAFILVLVNPWYALWFLLFTMVLQTIDGYLIKPRLFGEQLGVPGVWILISLIVCGRLLGVIGILMAIPIAAIGDFVYHDYILRRLETQKMEHLLLKDAADAGRRKAAEMAASITAEMAAEMGAEMNAGAEIAAKLAAEAEAETDADIGAGDGSAEELVAEKGAEAGSEADSGSAAEEIAAEAGAETDASEGAGTATELTAETGAETDTDVDSGSVAEKMAAETETNA